MATAQIRRSKPARAISGRSIRSAPVSLLDVTGDLDKMVAMLPRATPYQLVELERNGVKAILLKAISRRVDIPQIQLFHIIGMPKATAEKKVATGETISGSGGQATIGMARLIARAQEIVANSTAPEAKDFDAGKWLGRWLESKQPALGGRKPAELIGTPTGLDLVLRTLGALESGAYQ